MQDTCLKPLTEQLFNDRCPLIVELREKICMRMVLEDAIKIWNRAGLQIFHKTAPKLRDEWEHAEEHEEDNET